MNTGQRTQRSTEAELRGVKKETRVWSKGKGASKKRGTMEVDEKGGAWSKGKGVCKKRGVRKKGCIEQRQRSV